MGFTQSWTSPRSTISPSLGGNIILKDDVQLVHRTILKTGGKDTAWARNVLEALQRTNHPLRQQYARECQAQDDAYRSRAQALHEKANALRSDATTPAERTAATKWHAERAAKLAATLKRHPTFSEWCVTNKGRLEAEEMLRHDMDAQRNTMQQSKAQRIEYAKAHPEQAPQIAGYDAAVE
jgi:hypothetical protein